MRTVIMCIYIIIYIWVYIEQVFCFIVYFQRKENENFILSLTVSSSQIVVFTILTSDALLKMTTFKTYLRYKIYNVILLYKTVSKIILY